MTEQAAALKEEVAPTAPQTENAAPIAPEGVQVPLIDPMQEMNLKAQLLTKLKEAYDEFWKKLMHLPASGRHVPVALQHFDTGFLWMELAIKQLTLQGARPAEQPVPPPAEQPKSA